MSNANSNTSTTDLSAAISALLALVPEEALRAHLGNTVAPPAAEATTIACSGTVFFVEDGKVASRSCKRNATKGTACPAHVNQDVDEARAKAEKSASFVGWLRESAPAREARKQANAVESAKTAPKAKEAKGESKGKVLAAALRAEGLTATGADWVDAKAHIQAGLSATDAAKAVKASRK